MEFNKEQFLENLTRKLTNELRFSRTILHKYDVDGVSDVDDVDDLRKKLNKLEATVWGVLHND